jgi:hypothetical protein
VKVLSYNLEHHKAVGELSQLVEQNELDILCLQEAYSLELPTEVAGLKLADATRRNRLDLALYYRPERFDAVETRAFALRRGLYDILAAPAYERLLATRLRDLQTDREFIASSFHASPLTALNSLRRHQIAAAHQQLEVLGPGLPHLMVGDYNYPLFKNGLSNRVGKTGYDLTLSDGRTYTRYKILRGHFDFATSLGMQIQSVVTLPKGGSDHHPILVTTTLRDVPMTPDAVEAGPPAA